MIQNCCCTVSERKLTSLLRLGRLTDCLSWEDRLVSSVSLLVFACCFLTFKKTSACSDQETRDYTSYIDYQVVCIALWLIFVPRHTLWRRLRRSEYELGFAPYFRYVRVCSQVPVLKFSRYTFTHN